MKLNDNDQISKLHDSLNALTEETFADKKTTIKNGDGAKLTVEDYQNKEGDTKVNVTAEFKGVKPELAQAIINDLKGYFIRGHRQLKLNVEPQVTVMTLTPTEPEVTNPPTSDVTQQINSIYLSEEDINVADEKISQLIDNAQKK